MEEKVLLKIKRQFTENEAILFIQNELTKAKFKNGELESEVAELRHLNNRLRIELAELKKQPKPQMTKGDFKEQRFTELNKKLSEKGKIIKELEDRAAFWQSKYLSLKALNQTI